MADEPTLPKLPKVSWDSHAQTFTNTRKRNRESTTAPPLFSGSSDPAVFSSDDDPHVDNYAHGRHHKKRYVGSWFQQLPASSDSTFGEDEASRPKPKRTFERQIDSGVWMGSDEFDLDDDFFMEIGAPIKSKLPQLRNARPIPSTAPEDAIVRTRIDKAIEGGNPDVDLSSLGITAVSNDSISRLAELSLIPSVDKDVPFQHMNPELGIYLSNNRLTRAPGSLFRLEHLTYLSLRNNQISELPASISQLCNLRELNLSLNRLRYLPGELLNLFKYPSALASIRIHPNPFYRPEGCLPPRPEPGDVIYDERRGDVLVPSRCLGTSWVWQAAILARSPVQYCDSRGSALSKFRLPGAEPEDHDQLNEFGEKQHVALQTEDLSLTSVPDFPSRNSDTQSYRPSHVLPLYELALKSASRAAQTWDLSSCLPLHAPPSLFKSIERVAEQSELNSNAGAVPCSICGRQVITPTVQWIEWWDISKWEYEPVLRPLSMDAHENAIPFLKRGCSWNCTPKPMRVGQRAPGSLQFELTKRPS
ncbi:hypothetical protein F5Y19DRAFT_467457 [Xylariaceae sp. FL1651]|nr:hypothetical protein F5Y19DRAFT_467457 [Xylariaceae sp. FL1651]